MSIYCKGILHSISCDWHWIMFSVTLPPACYNQMQYLSQKHLMDVTKVFSILNAGKKIRNIKLGFYVVFFVPSHYQVYKHIFSLYFCLHLKKLQAVHTLYHACLMHACCLDLELLLLGHFLLCYQSSTPPLKN